MKAYPRFAPFATLWLILACANTAPAQMSAAEHASHHAPPPGGAAASPMASQATQTVPTAAGGSPAAMPATPSGMGDVSAMPAQPGAATGGMGEMMKGMGTAPTKEIYPTLMSLPDGIDADQRVAIDQLARERMNGGTAALSAGLEKLSAATSRQDYEKMQQATEQMREGLTDFETGVAAQRVIAEGQAPRNVALSWFRREMNLASPVPGGEASGVLGETPFHLFTMVLLVGFALAMLAMYYFKMRRAAALFGRLDPDKKPPPPAAPGPPGAAPGPSVPRPPTDGPGRRKPAQPGPPQGSDTPPSPGSPKLSNLGETTAPTETKSSASGEPAQAQTQATDSVKTDTSSSPGARGSPPSPGIPPATVQAVTTSRVSANWKGQLRIASIVAETPAVKTFRLVSSSGDHSLPFTYLPGQFLNAAFWIGGAKMIRSYSISSSPSESEYVELSIRREPRGAVSRHIDDVLQVGDLVAVDGPVGKFVFSDKVENSVVLISGGVGITPMMSISRFLTEQSWPGDIYFIFTCQTPADIIFATQLHELERRNPKFHLAITISKPEGTDWKGARGRITREWLMQVVPDLSSRMVHLCGPPAMMDAVKAIFTEIGSPPARLMTESFGLRKPAPAAPASPDKHKQKGPATGPDVTFSANSKSAKIRIDMKTGDSPPKQSILELSEELLIPIEFSCRVGTCGVCKVKKTAGEVDQAVQDALNDEDKSTGMILACQAKPTSPVTVEA